VAINYVSSDLQNLPGLREKIPLNRIGEPAEVARKVVALVSNAASFVTGRTIFADGGMTDYPDFAHSG
jgi:NAD(P)-dependent dehydrogenase (short-subunit alcohol dehydrogenase family)